MSVTINTTLLTDSKKRKEYPMASGLLAYFPAALAGVAKVSYDGNRKHNGNAPLQHSRWLSTDHEDCIIRHLTDLMDLREAFLRGDITDPKLVLTEASSLAWRALALSQELHEWLNGAPLAPGAKVRPDKC